MGYAQGGGLTNELRFVREKLRMEVAEGFRHGDQNAMIAHDLRVSVRSAAALTQSRVAGRGEGPGLEGPGITA
ncbi:transposase, partial [Streptomyces achromogenes]